MTEYSFSGTVTMNFSFLLKCEGYLIHDWIMERSGIPLCKLCNFLFYPNENWHTQFCKNIVGKYSICQNPYLELCNFIKKKKKIAAYLQFSFIWSLRCCVCCARFHFLTVCFHLTTKVSTLISYMPQITLYHLFQNLYRVSRSKLLECIKSSLVKFRML